MRKRLTFLPFLLGVSGVLAVVGAFAGYLLNGGAAALGAAAGVLFVAVAYTLSTVFIAWVETVSRNMMLVAALLTYAVKLVALALVLAVLAGAHWAGLTAMAFGVAAAALIWIVGQAWWISHAKVPYVDMDAS